MNKFKTLQEAGLASQVLTEVLNDVISFHYSQGYPGKAVSVSPDVHGEFWTVECGFDYVVALFIWQQECGQSGGYGNTRRSSWSGDALDAWNKWKSNATPAEYSAVERKVANIFNEFREDVANAKSVGYRWDDNIGGWTNSDSDDLY